VLPEQLGLPPPGFVQVVLAAGLSSRSTPVFRHRVSEAPTVHVSVFFAEAVLPNVGASTTARTAATPITRNMAFLFITFYRTKYLKKAIGKDKKYF